VISFLFEIFHVKMEKCSLLGKWIAMDPDAEREHDTLYHALDFCCVCLALIQLLPVGMYGRIEAATLQMGMV